MNDTLSTWGQSATNYLRDRWQDLLVPSLVMFAGQMVLLMAVLASYFAFVFSFVLARDYEWAPIAGVILLFTVMFVLIEAFTPLQLGFHRAVLKSMRGEKPTAGDVFAGYQSAGSAFALSMLTIGAVMLGTLLCYLPGLIVGWLLFLAVPALADRNQGAMDALATSYDLVMRKPMEVGLWYVVSFVILMVAAFIPMIGSLLTVPLWTVLSLTAYLFLSRERDGTG